MTEFYGRKRELAVLRERLNQRAASLIVIMGRRRIGKTRLIEEFGKKLHTITFTGLPPDEKVTAQIERDHFARQLQEQLGVSGIRSDDWDNLLWHLAQFVKKGRVVVVFDEINWMSTKDPSFLGKLKTVWDTHFKKNPKLIMILSGSMSGWIEKNILKSTGFFGRISLDITLEELPLFECNHFWGHQTQLIAPYEKFKILSVTGGIPRYLEEVDPKISAEENIRQLCFRREGLLFREYDRICTELFAKRGTIYQNLLDLLGKGPATLSKIYEFLKIEKTGTISEYLEDLEKMGYVARDYTWHIKDGNISPISHFRLKDNYIRFYLRYIAPHKNAIERGAKLEPSNWSSILGLQFENLILNNRKSIYHFIHLPLEDVLIDNP
jgi:AAA+ ATPase superfamily predicted ATPase